MGLMLSQLAQIEALLTCLHSRVRLLREEPHTQRVAEAAIGLGTDNVDKTMGMEE